MKFILIIINILITITLISLEVDARNKIVFCYYVTVAVYRIGDGKFLPSDIDPNLCTHIGYSHYAVSNNGTMISINEWADKRENLDGFGRLQALKKLNTNLNTILVVRIEQNEVIKFSDVINDFDKVQNFVRKAVHILDAYQLNGLNIDWDYPVDDRTRNQIVQDKTNFVNFLRLLKTVFSTKNYTLSAAVTAQESKAKIIYDIPKIRKYLNFINLKTYDLYDIWDNRTNFHSPLNNTRNSKLNVIAAVEYWLKKGVPARQLVLGISFYGHTYNLKDKENNNLNDEIIGRGPPGIYTHETGILGYNEICEKIALSKLTENFNIDMKSTYAYNDDGLWVSYENRHSISYKINYIKRKHLYGVMIWSIDVDDSKGNCGIKYPLLTLINNALGYGIKKLIKLDQ